MNTILCINQICLWIFQFLTQNLKNIAFYYKIQYENWPKTQNLAETQQYFVFSFCLLFFYTFLVFRNEKIINNPKRERKSPSNDGHKTFSLWTQKGKNKREQNKMFKKMRSLRLQATDCVGKAS